MFIALGMIVLGGKHRETIVEGLENKHKKDDKNDDKKHDKKSSKETLVMEGHDTDDKCGPVYHNGKDHFSDDKCTKKI